MQTTQRYAILSVLQAALGGVIAAAAGLAYFGNLNSSVDNGLLISMAGIGAAAVLYYISIHQFLKKKQPKTSALILSLISAANIGIVVLATGGLDSPYYALWLLGIVIAGLFGVVATAVAAGATLVLYGYELVMHAGEPGYVMSHLGQLAITLATAGIAEWIHTLLGRGAGHQDQVAELSGQLNEEALKSNVLMQSVGDGVLVVNAKREIQLFNPAAVKMTGWDSKSAEHIDYRLVLNLHDAKGSKMASDVDPFTAVWQDGKNHVRSDLTIETKAGKQVAVSLSLSPIYNAKKEVSGGIALFRDISAEREIQRQKDEFISTASHEMRTPVAAIEGYLSLAMTPSVATVDARAKSYLDKAHSSTQHLGELFRDLLSITKVEENVQAGSKEIFDLTKMTKETAADMAFAAEKKGLELQFGMADGSVRSEHAVMPVYAIEANPQRIREVIMNLIENAIKFTASGSIHVTIGGTNDTATVSVTDTGIGITDEDAGHLFQKFYRIDNSATRTIGGTGLGLYLCRTVIESFGGRIWIESKVGQGSSFKFSLPRLASDRVPAATTPGKPSTSPEAAAAPVAVKAGDIVAAPQRPTPIPQPAMTPTPMSPAPKSVPVAIVK